MVSPKERLKSPEVILFNGDADGLCALRLLAGSGLASPQTRLITGAKRETTLVKQLLSEEYPPNCLISLDLGLKRNRIAVQQLLDRGCFIQWIDHHQTDEWPDAQNFQLYLKPAPGWNTTRIVYEVLGEPQKALSWLLMGLWGDNMGETAQQIGRQQNVSEADMTLLQQGGELLNYNAYGTNLSSLCTDPRHLAQELMATPTAQEWIHTASSFQVLKSNYESDFQHAQAIQPLEPGIYCFPDAPWAYRMMGAFANYLSQQAPLRPNAVLVDSGQGFYSVSLRVPPGFHAAQFCAKFKTGGGRASSAGINHLPIEALEHFIQEFRDYFGATLR